MDTIRQRVGAFRIALQLTLVVVTAVWILFIQMGASPWDPVWFVYLLLMVPCWYYVASSILADRNSHVPLLYRCVHPWVWQSRLSQLPHRPFVVVSVVVLWFFLLPSTSFGPEPHHDTTPPRVAVIGAGAAGIGAAHILHRKGSKFTVFEKNHWIGGHAYAHPFPTKAEEPGSVDIDMGFIFGSWRSYVTLMAAMDEVGATREPSALSAASVYRGQLWGTDTEAPQEGDAETARFQQLADRHYADVSLTLVTFNVWLKWHGFSHEFRERYLTPMLSLLFVTKTGLYDIPARFGLTMFAGPTRWLDFDEGYSCWVMRGSSSQFYKKVTAGFTDHIRLNTEVLSVKPSSSAKPLQWHVQFRGSDGIVRVEAFDKVIMATEANAAYRILDDAPLTLAQRWLLSQVRYTPPTRIVLHTDTSVLPAKEYWRNFVYAEDASRPGEFELTGLMHRILGYREHFNEDDGSAIPLLTLDPWHEIDRSKIITEQKWSHHTQDTYHLVIYAIFQGLFQGGVDGLKFAGSYAKQIGHNQAFQQGIEVGCTSADGTPALYTNGPRAGEDVCEVHPLVPWLEWEDRIRRAIVYVIWGWGAVLLAALFLDWYLLLAAPQTVLKSVKSYEDDL